MAPDHPPFPTASNLPFHPDAGNQTSILISESRLGLNVAATRQNAARSLKAVWPGPPPRPPGADGGTNAPAATDCAIVIVVSGTRSDARFSHGVAALAGDVKPTAANTRTESVWFAVFMSPPDSPDLYHIGQPAGHSP